MSKQLRIGMLLAIFGSLAATAARGGAPGSADRQAALPNVCAAGPLQGTVCDPTEPDVCGTSASGQPFACVVDFVGQPALRGSVTLIADDDVGDNSASGGNPTITMLLELRRGARTYFFAETFQSDVAGAFPEVGFWLEPTSEDEIDAVSGSFRFQTPVQALGPLGAALREAAAQIFDGAFDFSTSTPVIFQLGEDRTSLEAVDQYASADLGQVARFRIEIRFLEP